MIRNNLLCAQAYLGSGQSRSLNLIAGIFLFGSTEFPSKGFSKLPHLTHCWVGHSPFLSNFSPTLTQISHRFLLFFSRVTLTAFETTRKRLLHSARIYDQLVPNFFFFALSLFIVFKMQHCAPVVCIVIGSTESESQMVSRFLRPENEGSPREKSFSSIGLPHQEPRMIHLY